MRLVSRVVNRHGLGNMHFYFCKRGNLDGSSGNVIPYWSPTYKPGSVLCCCSTVQ